jgi:hypothetical protein
MSGGDRLSGSHMSIDSYCDIVLLSHCRNGSLSRVCKPSTNFRRIAFVDAYAGQRRDPTNPIRME